MRLSLDSEQRTAMELRKKIANAIYKTGRRGLADVALSTKMWNGSNDTDYTDEEVSAIKEFVEKNFIPAVIVAVNEVIDNATKINQGQ